MIGVVLIPLALGVSVLVVNLCGPPLRLKSSGFEVHAIMCLVIYLMTSMAAYFASKIGRPARVAPNVMMETFKRNLLEIEEIV